MTFSKNSSFDCKSTLNVNGRDYSYFDLSKASEILDIDLSKLPNSMKVLFENLLRFEDGKIVNKEDISAMKSWLEQGKSDHEIAYHPARVLMQDFTGVPAVVDLAAMRDAARDMGANPNKVNPLIPVDLVIDHSVQVDKYGDDNALSKNVALEMQRNKERYEFLKWGQQAFDNFRVVPPGTGICHQVNIECLAQVVWTKEIGDELFAYPDTLVGTDSHTTMANGLSVLGWGVGGIEAEAAMLGQATSMLIPEVIGFKLSGNLTEGTTATDLVLTITQMLRQKGVVGKFVEFYGDGLANLTLADRATIANMAPEYGATCGFFPVDNETIKYLKLTARSEENIALVEEYSKKQRMWRDDSAEMKFTSTLDLDISSVQSSLAGPKRPQDKILLSDMQSGFKDALSNLNKDPANLGKEFDVQGQDYKLKNGAVVIAAITSCTNTSNPSVMIGAGLLARNAAALGIRVKPWVKTSLAPGSKVVSEYLERADLQKDLDELGFHTVGYGCMTCIGNSGPLNTEIDEAVTNNNLVVASVLSGNRNFEGRVHPAVRANYLASPALCVAYAIAGTVEIDLDKDPIAQDANGNDVFLRDVWPSNSDIADVVASCVKPEMFAAKYSDAFKGDESWQSMPSPQGMNYDWCDKSTYIKHPPYFQNQSTGKVSDIKSAKILALLGDSITTDHISPAGSIAAGSPAAIYLESHGIQKEDFNSYGSRRGNHEVMMRGTFANVRIKNEMAEGREGGYTKYKGDITPIYDAAMGHQKECSGLVVIGGKEYGTGSSRDWAAKGTNLLGVKAVIAESFERIHRSNLVGMGVIPLIFKDGLTKDSLGLDGTELIDLIGLSNLQPQQNIKCVISRDGTVIKEIDLLSRVDTEVEVRYLLSGGILQYVLGQLCS